MSRAAKLFRKKNNKRDNEILPENDEVYTNMIAYLRASDMTEYNQEKVREDLINMIVDGQNRGDDINKVMGDNYKEICDAIIEEMPKKTRLEKAMEVIMLTLDIIWIMGIITIVKSAITNLMEKSDYWRYKLSLGDLISWIVIGIVANVIVIIVCKTSFEEEKHKEKKDKVISFIKTWIICFCVICAMILPPIFIDISLITVHMGIAAAFFVLIFVIEKILSIRY